MSARISVVLVAVAGCSATDDGDGRNVPDLHSDKPWVANPSLGSGGTGASGGSGGSATQPLQVGRNWTSWGVAPSAGFELGSGRVDLVIDSLQVLNTSAEWTDLTAEASTIEDVGTDVLLDPRRPGSNGELRRLASVPSDTRALRLKGRLIAESGERAAFDNLVVGDLDFAQDSSLYVETSGTTTEATCTTVTFAGDDSRSFDNLQGYYAAAGFEANLTELGAALVSGSVDDFRNASTDLVACPTPVSPQLTLALLAPSATEPSCAPCAIDQTCISGQCASQGSARVTLRFDVGKGADLDLVARLPSGEVVGGWTSDGGVLFRDETIAAGFLQFGYGYEDGVENLVLTSVPSGGIEVQVVQGLETDSTSTVGGPPGAAFSVELAIDGVERERVQSVLVNRGGGVSRVWTLGD